MTNTGVSSDLFLSEVQNQLQPSVYADLIATAKASGTEAWGIWNLLGFRPKAALHLVRFTQEIMHDDAPIGIALRELIAAYTSSLNHCGFCTKAHGSVAAHLYGDEVVAAVLRDLETSPLAENEKAMLRFVRKVTLDSAQVNPQDIAALYAAGWNDTAIYYAIAACALFNFYNRFVSANGVGLVSEETFRRNGARIAERGYMRE